MHPPECRVSRTVRLAAVSSRTALDHIAHKLRLEFLRAALAANMHSALAHRQFFVPRCQMHYRMAVVVNRTPHHPPALASALQHSAVGPSATVKRTRNKGNCIRHKQAVASSLIVAEEAGERLCECAMSKHRLLEALSSQLRRPICTTNISPSTAQTPPAVPANPPQSAADLHPPRSRQTRPDSPADPPFVPT